MKRLREQRHLSRWGLLALLGLLGPVATSVPSAVSSSLLLSPGGQVTATAGVQVNAPARWRPEAVPLVRVEIQAVPERLLPVPLMSGVSPATAVYRIRAEPAVQTADAGRFLVRLPVKGGGTLVALRLTVPTVDLAPGVNGVSPAEAEWT